MSALPPDADIRVRTPRSRSLATAAARTTDVGERCPAQYGLHARSSPRATPSPGRKKTERGITSPQKPEADVVVASSTIKPLVMTVMQALPG
jgi:hypothetical protein